MLSLTATCVIIIIIISSSSSNNSSNSSELSTSGVFKHSVTRRGRGAY